MLVYEGIFSLKMVPDLWIEQRTSWTTTKRSNQLS